MGDYASGTNHVLPTYGYARMYSGVSLDSFQKKMTVQARTLNSPCLCTLMTTSFLKPRLDACWACEYRSNVYLSPLCVRSN